MKMGYGWTGKILRVDLTGRRFWLEPMEKYAERFIGGIGIGYKVFWDEVGPEVGAFDPENRLVFTPGPLTGTLAPGSGRMELVSKSPRSYPQETVTRSGMGGYWGAELKYAGYDALVIQGKSDDWVNLWIHDNTIEFLEAKSYLGEDTYETQLRMRKELGERVQILCIGPPGEKLSRLATIMSETSFASGRSGFGAVMGSKRLKAVVVRGTKPLKIHDPESLIAVSRRVRNLAAKNPMHEWTSRALTETEDQMIFLNKYRKKNMGCFGCPMQCFAFLNVPGSGQAGAHCTNYFYYPQATKFYGPSLERDQAVADGFIMANRFGLDTYEFKYMVRLLEDFYRAGLIPRGWDLDFAKMGSREFLRTLLESVAFRQGVGDLLAEGCARVVDQIKNGWEYCAKYFPAYGSAWHGSLRDSPGVALLWALDSRDPIIDQHAYLRLSVSHPNDPFPYKLPMERVKEISRKIFGSEKAVDHSTFGAKPEMAIYAQNRGTIINLLVVCDWIYPIFSSYATGDRGGDTSAESQLLAAVTGEPFSEEELNRVGERVWNLGRAIMVREGRTREEDTFHETYFSDRYGEKAVSRGDFEEAKTQYYQLRGWDEKTGWPTREKLYQLGLPEVAEGLTRE